MTKKQIIEAAKLIEDGKEIYGCHAMFTTAQVWLKCLQQNKIEALYYKFYDKEKLATEFGDPEIQENQDARIIGLLLYAEARKDVL